MNLVRFDADQGIAALKRGKNQPAPPQRLSLIPGGPIDAKKLAQSIRPVAESWERTGALPGALDTLVFRKPPSIEGCTPGEPLRRPGEGAIAGTVRIVRAMQNTTLAIQGPPGAGKTHTAAEAIVALIRDGFRVGVTSNSHKPVEKLMLQVLDSKSLGRTRVRATKVSPQPDESIVVDERATHAPGMKHVVFSGKEAANLVGGTAWAFSDPTAVGQFDYLFVDEAGQVSLANLVAMSPAARNIVLLGDQMQLAQPTQGSHPGESGMSALDYLMGGAATIPDSMGIFLATTWRMHPDLCRFISGAVYDDRLHAEPVTAKRLVRASAAGMKEAGLRFVPVAHEGNVQSSDEEVTTIVALVSELCGRRLQRDDGKTRAVTPDDILIVAPYNMQVLRLRAALPGVRVASVDKFQGQEAPMVIVSMCASSGEASPRGIEFLFSANRLNVAISRAQSLALVVASERLARTRVGLARGTAVSHPHRRRARGGMGSARDGAPLPRRSSPRFPRGTSPGPAPWDVVADVAAALHAIDTAPFRHTLAGHATRRDHALAELAEFEGLGDETRDARVWVERHLPPGEPATLVARGSPRTEHPHRPRPAACAP